jgi:hypothetical protein
MPKHCLHCCNCFYFRKRVEFILSKVDLNVNQSEEQQESAAMTLLSSVVGCDGNDTCYKGYETPRYHGPSLGSGSYRDEGEPFRQDRSPIQNGTPVLPHLVHACGTDRVVGSWEGRFAYAGLSCEDLAKACSCLTEC